MTNIEISVERKANEAQERTVLTSDIPGPGRYIIPGGVIEVQVLNRKEVGIRNRSWTINSDWTRTESLSNPVRRVMLDCSEAPDLQGSRGRILRRVDLNADGIGKTQLNSSEYLVVQSL